MKDYLPNDPVIIDIGANIGNHSVYFGAICKAKKIYSFEPIKDTYGILRRNIELNGLESIVEVFNIAIGRDNTFGSVKLYDKLNTGLSQVSEEEGGDIEIRSLDSFDISDVDFIKIDVEGFELNAIQGAKGILISNNPIVFIEIWEENFEAVNTELNECGYYIIKRFSKSNYFYKKRK